MLNFEVSNIMALLSPSLESEWHMSRNTIRWKLQTVLKMIIGLCSDHSILCCTSLHCTDQYLPALSWSILHCTKLHYIKLHCTVLLFPAMLSSAMHWDELNCTQLNCTTLKCTVLHCSALVFITVHGTKNTSRAVHWNDHWLIISCPAQDQFIIPLCRGL